MMGMREMMMKRTMGKNHVSVTWCRVDEVVVVITRTDFTGGREIRHE